MNMKKVSSCNRSKMRQSTLPANICAVKSFNQKPISGYIIKMLK
uniref:Uncharacterized protein n=1 Tax=Anguilla anguilla TaxID=7936 RepID=A0A0E9QYZ7_ANGAN